MNKALIFTTILLALTGFALTQATSNNINTLENEHFEIKIVNDYPSQGSMEALTQVNNAEKREIVLRNDPGADLKARCNTLYGTSITEHSNPCYLIN